MVALNLDELSVENLIGDVKAEVVGADFVESGLDIDNLAINATGLFERGFRKDVVRLYRRADKPNIEKLIFLDVCRDGLYDALPQGLFHKVESGKNRGVSEMLDEIKRNKAEEENTRSFFQAIEKELYRLRVSIELEERKSIIGFSDYYKSELYLNIWPELNEIDEAYLPSLFQILPICYKISGNIELTEKVMEYIINQRVSIAQRTHTAKIVNHGALNRLGLHQLGHDTILGDYVPDYTPAIEIKVGPVPKTDILQYFEGGKVDMVLRLLCDNLIPAEAEIKVTVLLNNSDEKLILSDNGFDGRLGFTSRI